MLFKKIGEVIALRIKKLLNTRERNKSTTTLHDWARHASDTIRACGPVAQAVSGTIPIAGAPLKNAIEGLLAILQIIDARIQNKEDLNYLTHRLSYLSCHVVNAPTARTRFEETSRQALIKVLEDTTLKLREMQSHHFHGSPVLTQQIVGCSSKINDHLLVFMALSQMQLLANIDHLTALMQSRETENQSIKQFVMALGMGQLPAGMTIGYVILVDATGRQHKMLSDQCSSFQQLHDMLPALVHQCLPDEAEVQRWYIDRGKYDFVLDDGTNVTELTRQHDLWSTIQAGTKIVMRVITEEVVALFSARYQCPCGTWNGVKVDGATIFNALEHGYCITW
ncbi:hypothetical protein EDC04DRAFT_2890744 [Pisolithus marmoratus]|nr:hypothetical protein EDC04DRAFT_2890744 [Pisolithus marmoratus]